MASGWLQKTFVRPPIRRRVNQSPQHRAHASTVCNGRNAKRRVWNRRGAVGPGGSSGSAAMVREESSSWKRRALIGTSFGPGSGGSAREQALVDDLLEDGHQFGVRNVLLE